MFRKISDLKGYGHNAYLKI